MRESGLRKVKRLVTQLVGTELGDTDQVYRPRLTKEGIFSGAGSRGSLSWPKKCPCIRGTYINSDSTTLISASPLVWILSFSLSSLKFGFAKGREKAGLEPARLEATVCFAVIKAENNSPEEVCFENSKFLPVHKDWALKFKTTRWVKGLRTKIENINQLTIQYIPRHMQSKKEGGKTPQIEWILHSLWFW